MKYLIPVILLIALAGLTYISRPESGIIPGPENSYSGKSVTKQNTNLPYNFAPSEYYDISCELDPENKTMRAEEEMVWINRTSSAASNIMIYLYPNAYKSSRTLYATKTGSSFEGSRRSEIRLEEITSGGKRLLPEFIPPDLEEGVTDSTTASLRLEKPVMPGDTVKIHFRFTVPLPEALNRLGYASGRNFFLLSQWFPKAGVFNGAEWICPHNYPYSDTYSGFGNYRVTITVPSSYSVAATGERKKEYRDKKGNRVFIHEQQGINDFAWIATDEILVSKSVFRRKNGSKVTINAFVQPENSEYTERYITAIKNSLSFFETHIGMYPYPVITLVDVPKSSMTGAMGFPTMITAGAELFSPVETHSPEYSAIFGLANQYFQCAISTSKANEAWLSDGLSAYMTSRILKSCYGNELVNFKLFGYYPVFGLNFVSYNELPLIYSLGDFVRPEGSLQLERYYLSPRLSSISDSSFMAPDPLNFFISSSSKPELMLISLERYLGYDRMMKSLRQYFRQYRFRYSDGEDFIRVIKANSDEDMTWFFENVFYSSPVFDYSIKYVRPGRNENEYEVFAERLGDGIFRQEIILVTENDTLSVKWNGEERWKKILFRTEGRVLFAEIDPERKNILDLNYANNSYTLNRQYGGSASLTFRWFFWIQNLLLYLGSVA